AAQVAGIAPAEEGVEVVEGALQRAEIGPRVTGGEKAEHRRAHGRRILDVDAVRDVVLVKTVLHALGSASLRPRPPSLPCGRLFSPPITEARINPTGDGR